MLELGNQALPQTALHQGAEILYKLVVRLIDQAHAITPATHQPGSLELSQLPADVRLTEPGGRYLARYIAGPLLERAEQPQASRFAEQAEEMAELLQELGAGHGGFMASGRR
jgi:hypothetical protein